MAQSDEYRELAGGSMNQDDALEKLALNEFIEVWNMRFTGTAAQQADYGTNLEDLVLLSGSLLPGLNQILGGGKFDTVGKVLGFRYNSAQNCQMVLYDANTNTYTTIYTDKTDSAGQILLPLNPQNEVLAILINQTYVIYWAKNLEVGYFNLNTLVSGGYGTVLAEDFSLLKPPCPFPPTGTYGNDAGQPANYWYGKLPRFIVQYVNADYNYTVWSTQSKIIVPYQQNTPTLGADVGQNNYIIISVNIGSIRTTTINIGRLIGGETVWSTIKSVDRAYIIALPNTTVNVATEIYEAYDPTTNIYSYASYGNEIPIPIDPNETDLLYDHIWPSNAGALLNGNIAALGDWSTLYARPSTKVTVAAIGYNANIGIPQSEIGNRLKSLSDFPGESGSGAGDHKRYMSITIGGIPQTGDVIVIVLADIRNATNTRVYPYTVPSGQAGNLLAVVNSIAETLPSAAYTLTGDGIYTIFFIGEPYFGLQLYGIELFFSGATVANSIPNMVYNTSYQVALEYFDSKVRPFPLDTDNTFIVNTPSYAQVLGQALKLSLTINTLAAPAGAVTYQVVITKPQIIKTLDVMGVVLDFKGTWDARTNTPTLAINSGTIGDTYQITTPDSPADTTGYTNLGNFDTYNTGQYVTNVGGASSTGNGQTYAILPKEFANLSGNQVLCLSLNSLNLFNQDYAQEGVTTILAYDYAVGDRCSLNYWIGSVGAIGTLGTITPGTGYTNGTYTGVALTGGTGTGAIATVVVAGNVVTTVTITTAGTGYSPGDVLTGTVTGGTGWSVVVSGLVTNGINYFNNPCINVAVLGYDPGTYIVKLENSAALEYSGSNLLYNGQQINARNIFFTLYSPAQVNQSTSTVQSTTEWFEVGEQFNITDGNHDTLSIDIFDGGAYYKTRQYPDGLLPYQNPPIQTLASDPNYSDFYPSQYYSFGRPRTIFDVLEQTEQKASIITSQPYILGSKNNGLNRFYPANIYGEGNGQTSSSYDAIQIMEQRGQELVVLQGLDVFYIPVNEAYTVLNDELTGQSISSKLLNNGRYAAKQIGIGTAKESFWRRYDRMGFIDPYKSQPYEITLSDIEPISGKMSKFFKSTLQAAYSMGKKLHQFYNDFYEEVVCAIQAEGGILTFFPFSADNWDVFDDYVIVPTDVVATPNGTHCTASYNSGTGLVTYTPASNYVGNDSATFTFDVDSNPITKNNCLTWTAGTTTVNTFSFGALINQPLSTVLASNTVGISGMNVPVAISITGGQYNINRTGWTSSAGTVNSGDSVQVRQTSSASNSTTTVTTLTVGGFSAPFSVTTQASTPAFNVHIYNNSASVAIAFMNIDGGTDYPVSILYPGQSTQLSVALDTYDISGKTGAGGTTYMNVSGQPEQSGTNDWLFDFPGVPISNSTPVIIILSDTP